MYLSRFVMFPGGYICSHFYLVDVHFFVCDYPSMSGSGQAEWWWIVGLGATLNYKIQTQICETTLRPTIPLFQSAMGNAASLYNYVSETGNKVVKAIRLKRKGTNEMAQ